MLNALSRCPQGRTPADWSSYYEPVTQRAVGMSEVLSECVVDMDVSRTTNASVLWEWQSLALGLREGRAFLCYLWSDWEVTVFAETVQCSFLHPHWTTLSLLSFRGQLTLAPRSVVYSKPISLVQACVINTLRWGGCCGLSIAECRPPGPWFSVSMSLSFLCLPPCPSEGSRAKLGSLDLCYPFHVSGRNCLSIVVGLTGAGNPVAAVCCLLSH